MRRDVRLRLCSKALILSLSVAAWPARATECGALRTQAAALQASATVEESLAASSADAARKKHQAAAKEAAAQGRALARKLDKACAPRRVTVAALPLGYLSTGPGNAARATHEPGDAWALQLTTFAGAAAGLTFADAAVVTAPPGARFELDGKDDPSGLALVIAIDAALTVEEPSAGHGAWRIEVKGKPIVAALARIRACAASAAPTEVQGARLSPASCQMLLRAVPLDGPQAVPERGRAVMLGEWQYGDRVAFELADELGEVPAATGPAPRVDLALELSAPIPGVSDGKRLAVTAGTNRRANARGATLKLAVECGEEVACQERFYDVEVWYDRAFAVPFVRVRPSEKGAVNGAILDRLGKLVPGQRVLAQVGDRRVLTAADPDSKYHFEGLGAGEITFTPVGRSLSARPERANAHTMILGAPGGAGPKLFIDKRFE